MQSRVLSPRYLFFIMAKLRKTAKRTSRYNIIVYSAFLLLLSILIYYFINEQKLFSTDRTATDHPNNDKVILDESNDSSSVLNKPFIDFLKTKEKINKFNRQFLLRINSLVTIDYFRYVKVNINRTCKLWCNTDKCNRRDCQVKTLSDPYKCPTPIYNDKLSTVNTELPSNQLDLLIKLFECNENDDHDAQYVDLLINPERYTGYSGETAHRVWRAIYEENCFIRKSQSPFSADLCYEKRLFYEAISGLHSSINIHLCAEYPTNGLISSFSRNLEEFLRRFESHNDYLENLYTLFLFELKALTSSDDYLSNRVNWPEASTRDAVIGLLKLLDKIDIPKFEDLSLKPSHISHELATHFQNITTTIIDCVACDKCKLWGKVQLRGLGAAFKILSFKELRELSLNHQEIISLINAIARLSHSIRELEEFRDLILANNRVN